MKRLWVQLSIVIAAVVIFVSLFPIILRITGFQLRPPPGRTFIDIPLERRAAFEAEFEKRTWNQVYQALLTGAILGVSGGVLLSRWLANPLKELENGAQAVANQQLDYRVPLRGSAEIQSVAQSFNQMAATLEKAEILRQNLLADVAHELRHPVHILKGNLQAILDGVYELSMEEVGNLLEETQHLAGLVNDLYEIAQAEAQKLPLHKVPTELNSLVANTVETFHPIATSDEINLSAIIPESHMTAIIDNNRVRQALQNIIANAINYTPKGGNISVSLGEQSTPQGDRQYWIQVTDTGIGISPENLPHVFDRFYRTDPNRSREMGGSGLGLAIAQAIIQSHGGTISANSSGPGQGSIFTIQIPAENH